MSAGSSFRRSGPAGRPVRPVLRRDDGVPGARAGLDAGQVEHLNRFAAGGLVPRLTLLFDLPPEEDSPASRDAASPRTAWSANPSTSTARCARGTSASRAEPRPDRPDRRRRPGRGGFPKRPPGGGAAVRMVDPLSAIIGQERAVALLRRYRRRGGGPPGASLLRRGRDREGEGRPGVRRRPPLPETRDGRGVRIVSRLPAARLRRAPQLPFHRAGNAVPPDRRESARCGRNFPSRRSPTALASRSSAPPTGLTQQAANALLKTLEEPPTGAHLILVAHRTSVLLPTIVSRCQRVPFFPLAADAVAEILSRHPDAGGGIPGPCSRWQQGLRGKPRARPLPPARARGGAGSVARALRETLPGGGGETRGELEGGGGHPGTPGRTALPGP